MNPDPARASDPQSTPGAKRRRSTTRMLLLLAAAAWLLLGAGLLLVVGADLALRGAFALKDALAPLPVPDPRVTRDGYQGASWVPELYAEQASLAAEWQPYSGFRVQPVQGRFVHVDDTGRMTWRPKLLNERAPHILVLGGSAAWGLGARDHETIPSHLARSLVATPLRGRVANAAQIGHVQSQEILVLLERLQAGERPRFVVFLDGVNDVLAALQAGAPGGPQNAANRRAEFNLLQHPGRLTIALGASLAHGSGLERLVDALGRRLGMTPRHDPRYAAPATPALLDAIAARCASSLRVVDALARQYDFQAVVCWQPVLFTRRQPTPYEREKAAEYAWLQPPLVEIRHRLPTLATAATDRVRFVDLGGVLDSEPGLVFVDFCHTTEAAGALVARAIARAVLEQSDPPVRNGGSVP
jgi:hypothetical protein